MVRPWGTGQARSGVRGEFPPRFPLAREKVPISRTLRVLSGPTSNCGSQVSDPWPGCARVSTALEARTERPPNEGLEEGRVRTRPIDIVAMQRRR